MIKRLKIIFVLGVLALTTAVVYWYFPYKVEGYGYYDKIWAHRTNSVAKGNSALNYFEGIEFDLVYDNASNTLDVNHPPAKSIGLNFETFFNQLHIEEQPFLWLDIKNLNRDNAYLILKRIEHIIAKKNYPKAKLLIETTNPEALPIFTRSGFLTSYYLPYGLSLRKPKDLINTLNKIKQNIKFQPNLSLSSDYQDYDIINTHFPKRTKYFWAIERPLNTKFKEIRRVLKDTTVQAVLLRYNVLKGER